MNAHEYIAQLHREQIDAEVKTHTDLIELLETAHKQRIASINKSFGFAETTAPADAVME